MGLIRGIDIVNDGLIFYMDAANKRSYPGSGTDVNNLMDSNITGSLINGTTLSTDKSGVFDFDGTDDLIKMDNTVANFERTDAFSVSAFIHADSFADGSTSIKAILANYDNNSRGWYIATQGNSSPANLWMDINPGANGMRTQTTSTVISTNTWYNVVGTYDGSSTQVGITLYLNGYTTPSEAGSNSSISGTIKTNGPTMVSQLPKYNDRAFWNGKIAAVKIYNKELSASEVLQNYNALKDRYV